MKLKGRSFRRGEEGHVTLIPEHGEDLWHVYNLVREGDEIASMTQRKVTRAGAKSGESETIRLKLNIKVEGIDFDVEGEEIRLKGRNLTETEHVRLGAYHTLVLRPNKAFTLNKEIWDSIDANRVYQSCDAAATADLAVLLITDGLGQLFLIGSHATLSKGTIEQNLPRKRGAAAMGYEKAWASFMDKIYRCVEKNVDFEVIRCLVIAGPGFAKDAFKQYLDEESVRRSHKDLSDHRDKVLTATASTAYKHGLKEVLSDASIANQIQNTKAMKEVKALNDFHKMLALDTGRAFYGPGHVLEAAKVGAIDSLLISDTLFRSSHLKKRTRFVQLVDEVQASGGNAFIFSTAHVSGEQLNQLSGIAAILRYPMPEIEEREFDDEASLFG